MTVSAAAAAMLYRWRFVTAAIVVAGAIAFAPQIDPTRIDNELTSWIGEDDPEYLTYERFRTEFGGTRTVIIAIKSDRLFTPEGLRFIDTVTRGLQRVELVERVESVTTANTIRSLPATADDDGGIDVSALAEARTVTVERADAVRRDALGDPLVRGDLVSEGGTVTAIVVTFDESRVDAIRGRVVAQVHAVVNQALPAGFEAHYNGSLEFSDTYNRVTVDNTRYLTPPVLILMLIGLYVMFRSVRKAIVIFVATIASVIWTLGLYSWLGFEFNVLSSMLTALVVVLAVADDVHIVQHYNHELRATGDQRQAVIASITHLFAPLLCASATTALGMLSLVTSNVVAVRGFGIGAAIGVMVDFALSMMFLPALLTLLKTETAPTPQEKLFAVPLQRAGRFAFANARLVFAVAVVLLVIAGIGVSRLRVDTNHLNFFQDEHPLKQSAEVIDRQLSGTYSFNVLLEGPPESLRTPDALRRMDQLSRELERLPFVRKVSSLATYVKHINRRLQGDDEAEYRVPDSAEAVAQELFVFGLSDAGRDELSRVVSSDYSRAHITVKLVSMSSDLVFQQTFEAERLANAVFAGSGITPTVTGSGRLSAVLDHFLVTSQITSFATAFVTVFGVILLMFRSVRFGVLGILANVFPIVLMLGLMGWFDISLNVATVMVASVALGIVDDDTIHFIGRYQREIANGAGTEAAIETAAMNEGRAALTTTLINTLGFTVLMASEYRPTMWFGTLLAATMTLAFLTEVFLVPAIIRLLWRFYGAPAVACRIGAAA
jgi:predicted RND superfamily exporter protein